MKRGTRPGYALGTLTAALPRGLATVVVGWGVCGLAASALLAAKAPGPAWPPPPAEPQIVFVRSISKPSDVGVKAPALKKLAGWLTGGISESKDLVKPFGLSLDESGGLLISDTGANAVAYVHPSRKTWRRWNAVGKIKFQSPVATACGGGVYLVADSGLGKVVAFDEQGKLRFEIKRELERPSGLVICGEKLYIVDSQLHQVVVCDLRGRFLSKFGRRGTGPGEFNFPTHIAADTQGQIYVTDALNCRVQVLGAEGQFIRAIGSAGDSPGHFSRPKGVAVDSAGHVYVIDGVFDNVQMFDKDGTFLLDWGETGSNAGEFWLPNAIGINRQNEIYVADSYNRRIQVFQYTGRK